MQIHVRVEQGDVVPRRVARAAQDGVTLARVTLVPDDADVVGRFGEHFRRFDVRLVGRSVIHDDYFEIVAQSQQCRDRLANVAYDVLRFVVGRHYYRHLAADHR